MSSNILINEKSEKRVVKRGFVDEDFRWFSDEAVSKLRIAQEEFEWLLDRGYGKESIINFIGDRYQFSVRQRNALQRATASKEVRNKRIAKMLPCSEVRDGTIYIDGFNLIITLEVALSNGVLILANDGCIRDVAGLRGTYSVIDKTDGALDLIGKVFENINLASAKFFLDAPVSNSGRLKSRILQHASEWNTNVEVELVENADRSLINMERVVTSDSIILDKCVSWINLSRKIVEEYIEDARLIELNGDKY